MVVTSAVLCAQDTINSSLSITQNLTTELVDGQRKLLALVASGNTKTTSPTTIQQTNGPLPGLPEMVNTISSMFDPSILLHLLKKETRKDRSCKHTRKEKISVSHINSQLD